MPEEKTPSPEEQETSEVETPKSSKKLLMIGLILLLQVVAAYGVAQFLILPRLSPPDDETVAEVTAPERGAIVMMDDVVVNLLGAEETYFLKVSTGLEYCEDDVAEEITERMPELRDRLINHLASRSVEEVITREGREMVKGEILEEFNMTLQSGQLLHIYFSDFVVQ